MKTQRVDLIGMENPSFRGFKNVGYMFIDPGGIIRVLVVVREEASPDYDEYHPIYDVTFSDTFGNEITLPIELGTPELDIPIDPSSLRFFGTEN